MLLTATPRLNPIWQEFCKEFGKVRHEQNRHSQKSKPLGLEHEAHFEGYSGRLGSRSFFF